MNKHLAVAQWSEPYVKPPQWDYLKEFGTSSPSDVANHNCGGGVNCSDYYKAIQLPQPVSGVIASSTPTASGWFNATWGIGLGVVGFIVAGLAVVAVKRGVVYVVGKIFRSK